MVVKGQIEQVLFIQGGGEDVHDSWDNQLVASLRRSLGPNYSVRYPRMPAEADPDPTAWKKVIARELRESSDGVFVVAHSLGAAIMIDYLAAGTLPRRLGGVFLIATPFIGDGGWPSDDLRPTNEAAGDLADGAPLYFYQGRDDETVPIAHIGMFAATFPGATIRRLHGRDHQINNDLSEIAHDIAAHAMSPEGRVAASPQRRHRPA